MKISVIIPNFNGSKLSKSNLPRVLEAVKDAGVIVVDDGSTDDSCKVLQDFFPQIKLIDRNKNEGFASCVNEGVKNATGDLVLLLNTDVLPKDDFLKFLLPHFEDPQVFAAGCLQKSINGGEVKKEGRGVGRFEKGFLMHGPGSLDKKNTLWVFGGAGMFRKEIWDKLGGLDMIYNPFYWEDIDLSYRALKAGYKLVFESGSVIDHHQQKGAIRNLYTSGQVKTIAYRNQILFVWLNITDYQFILNHLVWLPYHLLKSLVTGNLAFVKAYLLAVLKIPNIFLKRVKNKKLALISDRNIMADVTV